MYDKTLIKDHFGQYYTIQTYVNPQIKGSLSPKEFADQHQVSLFLQRLEVPHGYWEGLMAECGGLQTTQMNLLERDSILCDNIVMGRLKVFPVNPPAKSNSSPKKRIIQTKDTIYRFLPAEEQLLNKVDTRHFNTLADAKNFLQGLNPDETQLRNIASELSIPTAANTSASELNQAIAESMVKGQTAVSVENITSATPAAEIEIVAGGAAQKMGLGPEEEKAHKCELSTLSLKCSHSDRSYQLDVINDAPNLNDVDRVIQVTAKPGDPDKITIDFSGSCDNGNKHCPTIHADGDDVLVKTNKSPVEIKVLPKKDQREINSFKDFLKYYLVPDTNGLKYQTYTIKNEGCGGVKMHKALIHAFPTFKWEGALSFGYIQSDGTNKRDEKNLSDEGSWGIAGKIKGNIAEKNWEFKSGDDKQSNQEGKVKEYFSGLYDSLKDLVKRVDEFAVKADQSKNLVKFNLTWPSIQLGGNLELKESSSTGYVDMGGELSLKMAPLIKADVRTDLLEWLILMTGPYATFLQEIKTKAETDGIGGDNVNAKALVAIELILEGEVTVDLKWTKNADDKWLSIEGDKAGEASLGLTVGLEAKIKAETKIFYVKITIGAELHVKGAGAAGAAEGIGMKTTLYATTEKGKPAIGGKARFTGVAIYYTYYAELGGASDDTKNKNDSNSRRRGGGKVGSVKQANKSSSSLKEDEMKKLCVVFEENEWPKKANSAQKNKDEKPLSIEKVEL